MRTLLKKTLLVGLPLAGLLAVAPMASAHDRGEEHAQIHRDLGDVHDDFHQTPHSRREHRRFHRELKREHRALDRDLRNDWDRDGYDRYGYGGRYDDDYSDSSRYGRYGYDRRYDGDDYYDGSRYDPYGYGRRPSYDGGYYPGSSSPLSSPLGPFGDILLPR